MKKIRVIATSEGRVLIISCPSDLPKLLDSEKSKEWFYEPPKEFHEFIRENPEELKEFIEVFGYWVEFRAKKMFIKDIKRYERFEKEVKRFSDNLLIKLQKLASRIAIQIRKFFKPKHDIYDEYREKKLNKVKPGLGKKNLTGKQKKTITEFQKLISQYKGFVPA